MRFRTDLIFELRQQGALGKLNITVLKNFAKRLGFDMAQKISRKNLERSLARLMKFGVTATDMVQQTFNHGNVPEFEKPEDVTDFDVQAFGKKVKCVPINSSHGKQSFVVLDQKDVTTRDDIANSLLAGNAGQSSSVLYGSNKAGIAKQISKIFKKYSLNITGEITLPDGCEYDRTFNTGGGNCYFHSVCQGLNFFGISIDHVELRRKVG